MSLRRASLLAAAALLGGCTLIPRYQRPALPVAATYPNAVPVATTTPPADAIGWRTFFTDPRLQALIEIALRENRDLRVAVLNIAQAQGNYQVQRSDLFPQVGLSGAGQFGTLPESASIPSGNAGLGANVPGTTAAGSSATALTDTPATHVSYRYYTASVGFTAFELDLFGRLRSLTDAAFEQYLGDIANARATRISLIAQVATAYLATLADQALLEVTEDTLRGDTGAYDLATAQMNGGTGTLLSVRQAQTAVETARANLAGYRRQLAQDQDALVLLLGAPIPADLPTGYGLEQQRMLGDIPAGLPSDLLLRRPDIAAAEHNLLAANANVGAARAAFFPSITLTGSGGVAGSKLSHLFTGGGLTWSFEPQVNVPLFTAGQNLGNLNEARASKRIEIARYEQAIQTGFREVADGLAARSTYVDQLAAQQRLVDVAADSVRLATMRFSAGVDNYLPVLDAQQTLYGARQTLLGLQQGQLVSEITLYKALGGGWHA